MNKLLLFICCFLLLGPAAGSAGQGRESRVLGPHELREKFLDILKPYIPARIEEIRTSEFSSKPAEIIIPAGPTSFQPGRLQNGLLSPGKKFMTVRVLVDNREYAKVKMYGTVHFFNTVVVTNSPLARHTIIEEEQLTTEFRDVSFLPDNFIADPGLAVGLETTRSLGKGAVFYSNFLKNPTLVRRGDRVTITAKNGAVKVSAPGEIRNSGGLGETVQVKNLLSRQIVQATVIDKDTVRVEL